jgi:hypothetical protein
LPAAVPGHHGNQEHRKDQQRGDDGDHPVGKRGVEGDVNANTDSFDIAGHPVDDEPALNVIDPGIRRGEEALEDAVFTRLGGDGDRRDLGDPETVAPDVTDEAHVGGYRTTVAILGLDRGDLSRPGRPGHVEPGEAHVAIETAGRDQLDPSLVGLDQLPCQ